MGIKVERIDKVLNEIKVKKDHYAVIYEVEMLRNRTEELEQEKERAEHRLGELDTRMVYRDFTIHITVKLQDTNC